MADTRCKHCGEPIQTYPGSAHPENPPWVHSRGGGEFCGLTATPEEAGRG
ncbi:MAG: hypothetical protein INR66_14975 [Gordonia polyisoprenivorans]|nr:hypothetical protein [Gordonia polyisoprenivorans]